MPVFNKDCSSFYYRDGPQLFGVSVSPGFSPASDLGQPPSQCMMEKSGEEKRVMLWPNIPAYTPPSVEEGHGSMEQGVCTLVCVCACTALYARATKRLSKGTFFTFRVVHRLNDPVWLYNTHLSLLLLHLAANDIGSTTEKERKGKRKRGEWIWLTFL